MPETEVHPDVEKPLSGASRLGLVGAAGGVVLLFYLFVFFSVLFLLALFVVEFTLVVAAARLGLGGVVARMMGRHLAPLPIFLRSLWGRKGEECRISLQPEEAPELFKMVRGLCERLELGLPRSVSLEMNANAWVRLEGFRRGAGRTVLAIGYDLLAGLSRTEMEAVLAHELMHAKLIQRGLRRWLGRGLMRASRLAGALGACAQAARRAGQQASSTEAFLSGADWLARRCARLVAAYSRQEEFAADRGGAELCGAGAMRSALMKVESVAGIVARVPWRERVAQLHSGESFSRWLLSELSSVETSPEPESKGEIFNPYSSHPSLRDRLAALPAPAVPWTGDASIAIELLAEPDKTAEKLVLEVQRRIASEEERDSKELDRWNRKIAAASNRTVPEMLGVILIAVGIIGGVITWLSMEMSWGLAEFMLATIVSGILCYRFGGYREGAALPVPGYAILKAVWQAQGTHKEVKVEDIEKELRERVAKEKKARARRRLLAAESYSALGRCDYARAHVAARLCLDRDKKSVEGALALAVAAAALRRSHEVGPALQWVRQRTRMAGVSMAWGAAWALFLSGDWARAEALLRTAHKWRPDDPTFLCLLAFCQGRRGKLQSAILNARRACALEPGNKEQAKLLIDLLLDGGFLKEAGEWLARLETECQTDSELMFSMVRLKLMLRKDEEAEQCTALLKRTSGGAPTLLRLGGVYEGARKAPQAAAYYDQALATGYYPEALLGLGRLAAEQKNKTGARGHLLRALDVGRTLGDGSIGPLPLLHQTLNHLWMLEEPILNCEAWIGTLSAGAGPPVLANHSFVIYAPGRQHAEEYLNGILGAMQPGSPPALPSAIRWRLASKEQQPDGPVRPGVQGLAV